MKNLQRLCAAIVLALMLAPITFAGEISTGPGIAPPPPPPPQQSSVMAGGMESSVDTGEASDEAASLSPVAGIGLSVLQSVLALF